MDIHPAGGAARRHHLWDRQPLPSSSRAPAVLAVLLVALTGCADEPEAGSEETPAPPLDQPTEEIDAAQDAEPESGREEDSQEQAEGDQDDAGQNADDSEVLDASEFSSEPQESSGFPDMITEFPDDGDQLLLTEVRAGQHEGYDRIVFEHAGEGAPGWLAEYVDDPVEPGSGDPIEVEGEAVLYLSALGLVPGNAGAEQGHLELSSWTDTQGTVFEDAVTTFVHHGAASYYVGLDEQRDFRISVWEHEDGPRIIIDVLH